MEQVLDAIERAAVSFTKSIAPALSIAQLSNADARHWSAVVDIPPFQTYKTDNKSYNDFFIVRGEIRCKSEPRQWLGTGTYVRTTGELFESTAGAYGARLLHYRHIDSSSHTPFTLAPEDIDWQQGKVLGMRVARLAESPHRIMLVHWEPGCRVAFHQHPFGEELLVLSGLLVDDRQHALRTGTWVRLPPGYGHALYAEQPSLVLLRNGHLGGNFHDD